jgi:hypothetical protein
MHPVYPATTDTTDATTDLCNRSNYSDAKMKTYLTSSFESIDPDTAGALELSSLVTQKMHATAFSCKFKDRHRRREDLIIVSSYSYKVPLDDIELGYIATAEASKAKRLVLFNKLTPEDQARSLAYDAAWNATRKREYDESISRSLKALQKEKATADWFNIHCSNIDAKIDEITAKTGCCTDIVAPPPVKKSKPSAKPSVAAVQINLARAFREPDGLEPIAFLSKLNSQLKASDTEEARLTKSVTARALKLASRPVTTHERKCNKGVRALDREVYLKDQGDRRFAAWFQQHSVAIKNKIAGVVVVV